MSFQDKINSMLSGSLVRIWVASVKAKERTLGARVKGGLKRSDGQRVLNLVCKRKGEMLWQINLTGTMTTLADELMKIDDKGERPSTAWYEEHVPAS